MGEELKPHEDDRGCLVEGRNAVLELLRSGRSINKIYVAEDSPSRMKDIVAKAKEQNVLVSPCDRRKLNAMSETKAHQGVIASCAAKDYSTIEQMLTLAAEQGEKPFLILCDGLTDPHNLGAVIRSADTAGAHGVVILKNRAVGLTPTVSKSSAGAVEHVLVARVTNMAQTVDQIKELGLWVFAADASAKQTMYQADFKEALALVIGSEGEGVRSLVKKRCDGLVTIPMKGRVESLNASCAAAVIMYEVVRQRLA